MEQILEKLSVTSVVLFRYHRVLGRPGSLIVAGHPTVGRSLFDAFSTTAVAFLQAALGAPGDLGTSQTRSHARPMEPVVPLSC